MNWHDICEIISCVSAVASVVIAIVALQKVTTIQQSLQASNTVNHTKVNGNITQTSTQIGGTLHEQ